MAEPYNRKNIEEAARHRCAPPAPTCANGRCPTAGTRLMQAQQPDHDQGSDPVHYARERARSPISCRPAMRRRPGRGRRGHAPRSIADAKKRKRRALARPRPGSGHASTSCWRPRRKRRSAGRSWATPAIRSSTASGRCWARPASPCPSTPGRSACPCRCSSSRRATGTTSSSPGRAGWSTSS